MHVITQDGVLWRSRLGASLEDFAGNPAYNIRQLPDDLDRITFLLGGNDGGPLFGPLRE